MKILKRLFGKNGQSNYMIDVGESGFKFIEEGKREKFYFYKSIIRIVTYKEDLFTVDLIWFEIYVLNDQGIEEYVRIHEDTRGFENFTNKIEQVLNGFDLNWWERVTKPAFATNRITIYLRKES